MKKNESQDLTLPEFDPEKHWESWTDMIDQEYRAGDLVAVGITAGRSATLTIGMVVRINKRDSKGDLITKRSFDYETREWYEHDSATVTFRPLVDSANRWGRWTVRDSTVGTEKILKLRMSIGDIPEAMAG